MLVEIEPGRFITVRAFEYRRNGVARSLLPMPHVISDEMPPTEQVDGKFYTSKTMFRRVGRSLGLIEVGNEKFKPHVRSTNKRETKEARRAALKTAAEKYRAGHRARS